MNSDLSYCYLCRAYHDVEEGRCAWSWMKWGAVGLIKVFWYCGVGIGNIMGAIVLIGFTVMFVGAAYYFVVFLFRGFSLS